MISSIYNMMDGENSMDLKTLQEEYLKLKEENEVAHDELDSLEEKEYNLSSAIEDEKVAIEQTKKTLEELQDTIYTLESILEGHIEEHVSISEEAEEKRNKVSEQDNALSTKWEEIIKIQNYNLCQKALKVDKDNTYYVRLEKTTTTTPILTDYCDSDKEFLVLNARMYLKGFDSFSYIVIRNNMLIKESNKNIPTMSELKSVSNKALSLVTIPRMQHMIEYIQQAVEACNDIRRNQIIPLSKPCTIGGQTESNKLGYGWEWDWLFGVGSCIEGTNYGEMTGFSVIGIQIN